jgi:glycerol-3-phosphate O-acyltransferase
VSHAAEGGVHPPEVVIRSEAFQELIDEVAEESGRPRASVTEEIRGYLDEMSAVPSSTSTSQLIWKKLSNWMARAYQLDVDDHGLSEIKKLGEQSSLIFLPNHRSYLDPIILRSTLAKRGFPPNYVLGGDNLAFWPMAPLARRNGIVFIRREFRDAQVYKLTLRAYLAYLLDNHANLEWYIEGGRSRTGKLRPPRYGILSYVVDAFVTTTDVSAYCVPVSITYDQQHEIGAISAEEMGGSKSPESIKWLVQYARDQSRSLGRVHLRFGQPLSISEALEDVRSAEIAKAAEHGEPPPENPDRYAVPKIAFEVSHRINTVTPITPTSLVTFVLLDNDDRALTIREGMSILRPLIGYMIQRGLPLTSDVETTPGGGLDQALTRLVREGVISKYAAGTEPVYSINAERMHEAGFYRNSIAHHFVTRAMVELALLKYSEDGADHDVTEFTWQEVLRLQDLLKFEFFFARKSVLAAEVEREVQMVVPDWRNKQWTPEMIGEQLRHASVLLAHRSIGPFLEAYEVAAVQLAERIPSTPTDKDEFIDECIGVGHQWWLQQRLYSPESISKNLFSGALQLAGNRDLLGPGREELRERRVEFARELTDAVRRVQVIRRMSTEWLYEAANRGGSQ